ncbi:FkbM family methyltransferase [Candidatus Uhrbacteria bacterium]|nr:FkbM family methyltransferase [Candidatus Uhrbacteria bacterium]
MAHHPMTCASFFRKKHQHWQRRCAVIGFGDGAYYALKIIGCFAYLAIQRALTKRTSFRKPKAIRCKLLGHVATIYVTGLIDFALLYNIFIEDEYKINLPEDPHVIFDIGSNIGFTVLYFHFRYPNATIVAFEPDPRNFSLLTLHAQQVPGIILYNQAIAADPTARTLTFYSYQTSHWSSSSLLHLTSSEETPQQIKVPCTTLDHVMQHLQIDTIDLMKFDIEGAEFDIFEHFTGLHRVRFLIGEVHPRIFQKSLAAFLDLFRTHALTYQRESYSEHIVALHQINASSSLQKPPLPPHHRNN